jgi:hypothetical protein
MALSDFAVVHARTDGEEHTVDEPLIHCFDGKQLVLAFVERTALADYFRLARRPGMRVSNLIVDRNLEAFARIVTAKYSSGQVGVYSAYDQSFPRLNVTLEDMERSGERFTADVLKPEAAFQWTA